MKKYSPSSGGFYETDIHKTNIPEDAIDVSDEEYEKLFTGQGQGKRIVFKNDKIELEESVLSIESIKKERINYLKSKLEEYIYLYFPVGTQMTLQAMYCDEKRSGDVKKCIKEIFDWIESVLGHYYSLRDEINQSQEPKNVEIDFEYACSPDRPTYNLEDLLKI